ncbi:MAG: hypothetical protein LLF92_08385 [Planctomycetaceae bacterium]|nr:hypothetical protein [Planctomycetaceae bacterium]
MQNEEKKGEFISDIVGKISNAKDEDYTEGMPTFDLGSQILAQHRKIAAMKRKSPGSPASTPTPTPAPAAAKAQAIKFVPVKILPFQKSEPIPSDFVVQASTREIVSNKIQNLGDFRVAPKQSSGAPLQPMSPQQRIIADIVAREIKVLTSATR